MDVLSRGSYLPVACSVYVFGGMDEERAEQMCLWRWDLGKDEGFELVHYR